MYQDAPPYQKLYVHGFTLDEAGKKMSKSLGNVVSPAEITQGAKGDKKMVRAVYGVDVLRWWVAANGSQNAAILVGDSLLAQTKSDVDRLRNVFKFLLGNCYNVPNDPLPYQDMLTLDKYILHQLAIYSEDVSKHYDEVCL